MEMEDYAGKSDRDLLIEIHTVTKHTCETVDRHEKDIEKLKSDNNKAKGGLIVISSAIGVLGAKLAGLF